MKAENVKQIITSLRSTLYTSNKTYSDDYSNTPRPFYNFLIMIEGAAYFQISPEKSILAEAGDIIWLPKGSTFHVEWRGTHASWHVVHFDLSSAFNPFLNRITSPQKLNYPTPLHLLEDFQRLSVEKNPYLILSTFYRIFAYLFPLIERKSNPQQKIIQPALTYLEAHYREKIYIKELASMCLLSRSKFQLLFKQITNKTPIAYKNVLLIQALQKTLVFESNKSLETLSFEYGFDSTVYMCRLFKKIVGKTPTEYRTKQSLL